MIRGGRVRISCLEPASPSKGLVNCPSSYYIATPITPGVELWLTALPFAKKYIQIERHFRK